MHGPTHARNLDINEEVEIELASSDLGWIHLEIAELVFCTPCTE